VFDQGQLLVVSVENLNNKDQMKGV